MRVVIVGASRGIGLEFCCQYKEQGHDVVALVRNSNSQLEQIGVEIVSGIEVTNKICLENAAKKLSGIDLFIHNAGILRDESLADLKIESIREQFEVNTIAPMLSVKSFLSSLSKGAKVCLMSSQMGSMSDNSSGGRYGYRMSKAALNAFGKSLSIDLKDQGHAVGILHPGYVKTDMTGGHGLIDVHESVQGLRKIISNLSLENTGSFWHTNGKIIEW